MKRKKKPDIVQEAKFTKEKTPYRTIKTSLKSIIKTPEIQKLINDLVLSPILSKIETTNLLS